MMPQSNVAQEPSPDHTFITPPPFNPSFNPSTDYNHNQFYRSSQPVDQSLPYTPIPYQDHSQRSHWGESSQTSNYSYDDFDPSQNTHQTNYSNQFEYTPFNLPTPSSFVPYPDTNYQPQWPIQQSTTLESLDAELHNDDLFNNLWTNSTQQMENLAQYEHIVQPRVTVESDQVETHKHEEAEE